MAEIAVVEDNPQDAALLEQHLSRYREATGTPLSYTIANSNAMNGLAPGGSFVEGMRIVDKIIIGVNTVCVLLILWIAYTIFRTFKPSRRKLAKLEKKAAKKAAKQA